MGLRDVVSNDYMGNSARVADLLNGYMYHGVQRIKPEEVREVRNVFAGMEQRIYGEKAEITEKERAIGAKKAGGKPGRTVRTVTADVAMEVGGEMCAMIVLLEDQTDIHYAMPIRVFHLEALGYLQQ